MAPEALPGLLDRLSRAYEDGRPSPWRMAGLPAEYTAKLLPAIVGFEVAVETNGTRLPPQGIDWICVSPKAGAELVLRRGQELKLVFPQADLPPARFETPVPARYGSRQVEPLLGLDFQYFYLQPMDGPEFACNILLATEYCLEHPQWRLSLQTHKLLKIR